MNLLAIETATREGSVALVRPGDVREVVLPGPADQTLMPVILDLGALDELDGVAVDLGPGMFTSMRVGIATAKTLAAALDIPVAGIASLDVIARAAFDEGAPASVAPGEVAACLNAGRGEVYFATYRAVPFERMTEIRLTPAAGVASTAANATPRAGVLARIALERFERGEVARAHEIEPLYVRRTDAEINWEVRGGISRPDRVKARGE